MKRFLLNDNLKKYIREEKVPRDKDKEIEKLINYLEDDKYTIDLRTESIHITQNHAKIKVDFDKQCVVCNPTSPLPVPLFSHPLDHKLFEYNDFLNIPFELLLSKHAKISSIHDYSNNSSDEFIDLINRYRDESQYKYEYKFIEEAFDIPNDNYFILYKNNDIYTPSIALVCKIKYIDDENIQVAVQGIDRYDTYNPSGFMTKLFISFEIKQNENNEIIPTLMGINNFKYIESEMI